MRERAMPRILRLFAVPFALFLSVGALTGCAFTNAHVSPSPVSTTSAESGLGRGRGREVIVVGPFEDARDDKHRCGVQKNGFGLQTADIVCDAPVGEWIADDLAARLSRDGFRVLSPDAVPGPTTVIVRGSVKRLFIEPHATVVQGDAVVDLVVSAASGFHASKTVEVRVKRPVGITTEDFLQATIDQATRHLAVDMAGAIVGWLEPRPDLGAPSATKLAVAASGR